MFIVIVRMSGCCYETCKSVAVKRCDFSLLLGLLTEVDMPYFFVVAKTLLLKERRSLRGRTGQILHFLVILLI